MISLSRLRMHVELPPNKAAELALIRQEVMDLFERETGLLWARRVAHVETFELENDYQFDEVMLSMAGDVSITTVETRNPGDSWTAIADTGYELLGVRRVKRINDTFMRRVRVTYDGGYTDESCPGDVQRALLAQAAFIVQRTSGVQLTQSAQAVAGGSTTFLKPDLHPVFAEIANARKRKA